MRCPICHTIMNIAKEEKGMMVCPECGTHVKNGQIMTVDQEGELNTIGYETSIDFYFDSKDKKRFHRVVSKDIHPGGWMILTKADGKQVLINKDKVNFVEEV